MWCLQMFCGSTTEFQHTVCTNITRILNNPFKRDISSNLTDVELQNDCEYMHWIVLHLAVHSESSHKQNILHSFGCIQVQNDRQSRGEWRTLKDLFSVQEQERRSWQAEGQLHMSVFLHIFCRQISLRTRAGPLQHRPYMSPVVSADSTSSISRQYQLYQQTVPLVSADGTSCNSRECQLYQHIVSLVSADSISRYQQIVSVVSAKSITCISGQYQFYQQTVSVYSRPAHLSHPVVLHETYFTGTNVVWVWWAWWRWNVNKNYVQLIIWRICCVILF